MGLRLLLAVGGAGRTPNQVFVLVVVADAGGGHDGADDLVLVGVADAVGASSRRVKKSASGYRCPPS